MSEPDKELHARVTALELALISALMGYPMARANVLHALGSAVLDASNPTSDYVQAACDNLRSMLVDRMRQEGLDGEIS